MSTFQTEEEETKTVAVLEKSLPRPSILSGFPDQTPDYIASRWYQIGTQTIGAATAAGMQFFEPSTIMSQAAFVGASISFRYFKFFGIHYKIQMTTTPMTYGYAYTTTYGEQFVSEGSFTDYQAMSQQDAQIIDFAVQEEMELCCSWRTPSQWIDLADEDAITNMSMLHRLYLGWPVNPVKTLNSSAGSMITFLIFARFMDPEFAGNMHRALPTLSSSGPPPLPKRIIRAQAQMGDSLPLTQQDLVPAAGGGGMSTLVKAASALSTLGTAVWYGTTGIDYLTNKAPLDIVIEGVSNVTSASLEATQGGSPEEVDKDLRPSVYGSLFYSKPRYNLGTGGLGIPGDKNSIKRYLMMPTLWQSLTLPALNSTAYIGYLSSENIWSRLNFMAQFYRYWRGSRRFTLVFITSPFVSARYNIALTYGSAYEASGSNTVGDVPIMDVTVRGTTRVDFAIPYLYSSPWQPTWSTLADFNTASIHSPPISEAVGARITTMVAPTSIGDVTPQVLCLVFTSAGPDYEFRSQRTPNWERTAVTVAEAQMRIAGFCKTDTFGPGKSRIEGHSSAEFGTFEDLGARWQNAIVSSTVELAPNFTSADDSLTLNKSMNTRDALAGIFRFWTGGVKVKAVVDGTTGSPDVGIKMNDLTTGSVYGTYQSERIEDGMNMINANVTRVLEATVPFISNFDFLGCSGRFAALNPSEEQVYLADFFLGSGSILDPTISRVLIANSPEFRYFVPMPPPIIGDWPMKNVV